MEKVNFFYIYKLIFVKDEFYNIYIIFPKFYQIFFLQNKTKKVNKEKKKNEDLRKNKNYCEEEKKAMGKTGIKQFNGYFLSFNLTHDIDISLELL